MAANPRYRSGRAIEQEFQETGSDIAADFGSLLSADDGSKGFVEDFLKVEMGSRVPFTFTRLEGRQ
jgi:hypothetical protein